MRVRTSWPWVSMVLIAFAVLNPIGLDVLRTAFFAGEQLARSIAQFVAMIYLGGLFGLALAEFGLRLALGRRQARLAAKSLHDGGLG